MGNHLLALRSRWPVVSRTDRSRAHDAKRRHVIEVRKQPAEVGERVGEHLRIKSSSMAYWQGRTSTERTVNDPRRGSGGVPNRLNRDAPEGFLRVSRAPEGRFW